MSKGKTVVVRYTVKPERVPEHEALVRGVFEALAADQPAGFRYHVVKMADGASFLHVARIAEGAPHPLKGLAAFRKFQENIAERCATQPVSEEATELGAYDRPGTEPATP
jgi:hypothetical protein